MPESPLSAAQAARRTIASRLDGMRRDAGLTGHELAVRCGWHKSKASRIARAKTAPSDADIRAWCDACGAAGHAADLIAASRTADSMYVQWRQIHRDGMRRVHESTVPLYERTTHFRVYASNVLPGMLQTSEYATGILRSVTAFQGTPDDVADAVRARLARSRVVYEGNHRFALLVEEAVLHYRVCDEPEMAAQLRYLREVMDRQNVSLGIIPVGARRTVWPLEAFYAFDDAQVAVETLTAEVNITAPSEVHTYLRAFAELSRLAVYGTTARDLIAKALNSTLA
ncbi:MULTISPECIES: helix-turn-helix domain-containing protein [Streptomyces]|uniref:helix-turn-helix domain-containing protein n=1 Tax=Streptomyces TaxID=1883 RepID=UPI001C2F0973|nr:MULTISPECIES: helix-turn-helix transcriptional regulator [Streptomyces]MBV1947395.1 helix-turn-helix transcriptional regulator [Streptomyces sp. BV129]BDH07725.1 transcriptional regulator [Streptomyces seoulensis]